MEQRAVRLKREREREKVEEERERSREEKRWKRGREWGGCGNERREEKERWIREKNMIWAEGKVKKQRRESEIEEKERERREKKDRRKKERNVVWRGVEERCFVEEIMTMLGRVAERKGEAGKWVLITELKKIADKEEVLDRGGR